jgi:hypothetical protein
LAEHVVEPLEERVARGWLVVGQDLHAAADGVVDDPGRVSYGPAVLDVEVSPHAWLGQVAHSALDQHGSEGRDCCVGAKSGHERRQILLTRVFIVEARNPEHVAAGV